MPSFHFTLEPVLRYRSLIEEECQRDLAMAIQERVRLQEQLQQMQQTIVDSKRQLGDALVGVVNLDRIGHFARYSSQARARAQGIVMHLAGVEKQIEARREKLLRASKARKALELLRDRQHDLWKQHQDRIESAALDEFAAQAFARRQAEESE